ncbi:MAG: DUF3380 domain-containing protein, partial [Alphaproteobacteria bacterium]|nr:DUF3380 domain-containing protein [Alphaproteobacteria bacterium]
MDIQNDHELHRPRDAALRCRHLRRGGAPRLRARRDRAVCDVESAGSGFLPDTRPKLLFEAHVFGKLTRHCWDDAHPNISAPSWDRALYGPPGAHQYDRLEEALALDATAALEAASWGLFQILGSNFALC